MEHIHLFKEMLDSWTEKQYWEYYLSHIDASSPSYLTVRQIVLTCGEIYKEKCCAYDQATRATGLPV